MAWLRLDADIFENPKMIDLPMGAQYLFLRICCAMKSSSERVSLSSAYWSSKYWSKRIDARQSDCEMWLENLQEKGLIEHDGERLMVHNWREYQSDATAAQRKAEQREREKEVTDVTVTSECHGCHADPTLPYPTGQDIHTEKETPHTPRKRGRAVEYGQDFLAFWGAYPRRIGKKAAARAYAAATDRPPLADILAAIEAQKGGDAWTRDGGAYIPHPATWLNQGRWADEVTEPRNTETPRQREEREKREEEEEFHRRMSGRLAAVRTKHGEEEKGGW